jgi:pantetheine-phosphate adenylyltransferase
VKIFDGLTVEFAREEKASYIIRGLRSQEDFIYEQQVAEANKTLIGIETIFFCSDADKKEISSSLLRELKSFGKDISDYLPELY